MKIVPIFDENLYAVKYEGEELNEFERLFELWSDIEYLNDFFEKNKSDLNYYRLTIERAVKQTLKEAQELEDILWEIGETDPVILEGLFRNLDNKEMRSISLSRQKAKPETKSPLLRIYAIRIDENVYLITGGAIKLTLMMDDRPHTKNERIKLEQSKTYLQDNDVFDVDSFNEMIITSESEKDSIDIANDDEQR